MINIQKNVKLSQYSTFKIGGPAEFFVEVKNEEEFLEAMQYAKENNLKFFILGGGSNVLFDDKGFDGLIIKILNTEYDIQDAHIECGAGLPLSQLVNIAKENNLSGLEWATGIPGTVGGAVRGNAEAFKKSLADSIKEVKVYDVSKLKIKNYKLDDCQFNYRDSIFKRDNNLVIVSAKIKLEKGNKNKVEKEMKEISDRRFEKQPKGWVGSAGSFFMNPEVKNQDLIKLFEKDTGSKSVNGRIPAGWLIEEAGFKGKKIGKVMVSDKNANFIVNTGGGTAEEIIMLSSIIKQKIRVKFGIQLKEEVKIVYY